MSELCLISKWIASIKTMELTHCYSFAMKIALFIVFKWFTICPTPRHICLGTQEQNFALYLRAAVNNINTFT
jgi:hypothetical protein